MAIVLSGQSEATEYAWGWQARFELRDDATERLYSADSLWPATPTEEEVADAVAQHVRRITAEVYPPAPVPPEPEYRVICEDGAEVTL